MHYDTPTPETLSLLSSVMEEYYPDLIKNNVTVDITMAFAKEGEPLKCGGYPALAFVKATPLKHRVKGLKDAEITIDGQIWETLTEPQQRALLDHQLCSIKLVFSKDGTLKLDDANRPKLSKKKCDYHFNWFRETAKRHGKSSIEVYQAGLLWKNDASTFFDNVIQ